MRKIEEIVFRVLMAAAAAAVMGALGFILLTICIKGFPALSIRMLTRAPEGGGYIDAGGGILNAIAGSLVLCAGAVLLAFLISIPVVFYLHLWVKRKSRFASLIRFSLNVLWGIPSIVYGIFGFAVMASFGFHASLLAGIITVALLIMPIMARSMDEVLKPAPFELKESAFAIGATRLETGAVLLKQSLPGIVTAVLIAFGRAIGDAASVLFTAGFSDSLPYSILKPVATLPLAIFFQLGTPFPEVQQRGYAAAMVLTIIIIVTGLLARSISKKWNS